LLIVSVSSVKVKHEELTEEVAMRNIAPDLDIIRPPPRPCVAVYCSCLEGWSFVPVPRYCPPRIHRCFQLYGVCRRGANGRCQWAVSFRLQRCLGLIPILDIALAPRPFPSLPEPPRPLDTAVTAKAASPENDNAVGDLDGDYDVDVADEVLAHVKDDDSEPSCSNVGGCYCMNTELAKNTNIESCSDEEAACYGSNAMCSMDHHGRCDWNTTPNLFACLRNLKQSQTPLPDSTETTAVAEAVRVPTISTAILPYPIPYPLNCVVVGGCYCVTWWLAMHARFRPCNRWVSRCYALYGSCGMNFFGRCVWAINARLRRCLWLASLHVVANVYEPSVDTALVELNEKVTEADVPVPTRAADDEVAELVDLDLPREVEARQVPVDGTILPPMIPRCVVIGGCYCVSWAIAPYISVLPCPFWRRRCYQYYAYCGLINGRCVWRYTTAFYRCMHSLWWHIRRYRQLLWRYLP
jgi:hypothetical protein